MRSLFRCLLAAGVVLALRCPQALAVDLYGTPQGADSVLQSARPGEYYYNLGADAVRHKDYAHAVEMYAISASWAYKTSEYNLGVMYARGEGVAVDLPRALAWMALAAERNDKEYVQARDLIASMLDKNGIAQAEAILKELLPTYGDAVALNRAKTRWVEVRNGATGSHLGFTGDVSVGANVRRYIPVPSKDGKALTAEAASKTIGDLVGTSGVPGVTAYYELRMTDNPYDPRFSSGVATVGPVTPLGERKASADQLKKDPASNPADPQKQ